MASLLAKYTWVIDTLRRYGRLTREEINDRWINSDISNGAEMTRRTFYNYRQTIADVFGIEVLFDATTKEYYLNENKDVAPEGSGSVTDYLLNTAALSGMLGDARTISDRVFLEQVPSARQNLAPMILAIKQARQVKFTYRPFTRSRDTRVILEPYLLKLFRQRWYVAGRNVDEGKLKTYALDRVTDPEVLADTFIMDPGFDPKEYFRYSFGIVVDSSEPRVVTLKANRQQARYLRALPLHSSQEEMITDDYSIFTYRLLLTPDFLRELMSLGPEVQVVGPPELRLMLADRLRQTIALY